MTRTTPIFSMTPDYTPIVRMLAMQTRFAIETSQGMMKLAMLPWTGLPKGFGSICTPLGSVTVAATVTEAKPAKAKPEAVVATTGPEVIEAKAVEVKVEPAPKVETPAAPAKVEKVAEAPAAKVAEASAAKVAETPAAKVAEPAVKAEEPVKAPAAKVEKAAEAPAPKAGKVETVAAPAPKAEAAAVAETAPVADAPFMVKPKAIKAPAKPDDLTVLNGVGPKLAEALHAEGIYTYAQIAAWTEANVAWADENLPGVPGRASRNGWVAQAAALAK